jgi:hypothetical protein
MELLRPLGLPFSRWAQRIRRIRAMDIVNRCYGVNDF